MGGVKICMVLIAIMSLIYSTKSSEIDVKFVIGLPRLNSSNIYDYYFICTATGMMIQWETNDFELHSFVGRSSSRSFTGTRNNFTFVETLVLNQTSNGLFMFTSVLIVSCQDQCYLDVVCRINESSFDNTTNMNSKQMVQNETKIDSVFLQYLFTENIITAGTSKALTALICGVQNRFMLWQLNGSDFDVEVAFSETDTVGRVRQQKLQDGSIPVDHLVVLIGDMPYSLVTILFVVDASGVTATCKYSQNTVIFTIDERGTTTTSEGMEPSTASERMEPSTASEIHGSEEVSTSTTTKNAFNESTTINNDTTARLNILALVFGTIVPIIAILVIVMIILLLLFIKKKPRSSVTADEKLETAALSKQTNVDPEIKNASEKATLNNQQDIQAVSLHSEKLTDENLPIMNVKRLEQLHPDCDKVYIILSITNRHVFRVATSTQTAPDGDEQDGTYIGKIGRHTVGIVKHKEEECLPDLKTAIRRYFEHAKYIVVVGLCYCFSSSARIGDVLISDKLLILRTSKKKEEKSNEPEKYTVCMNDDIKRIFCEEKVVEGERKTVHIGKIASGPLVYTSAEWKDIAKKDNCIGCEDIGEKIITLQEDGITINFKKRFFDTIFINSVIETIDSDQNLLNPNAGAQAVVHSVINKIKESRMANRRHAATKIVLPHYLQEEFSTAEATVVTKNEEKIEDTKLISKNEFSERSEEQRRQDDTLKVSSAESSLSIDHHSASRSVCSVCDQEFNITAAGVIRVHGPQNNRCPGSKKPPASQAVDPMANTASIELHGQPQLPLPTSSSTAKVEVSTIGDQVNVDGSEQEQTKL